MYSWTFPGGVPGSSSVATPGNVSYSTPGSYAASFTVSDDKRLASKPATRAITVSNFTLSATPASQAVPAGQNARYTATVTPVSGFTGTVAFTVTGLPAGAVGTFTPPSVAGSGSTSLLITTTGPTPSGTYPLVISGTSGSIRRTANVTLIVSGDFALAASPSSRTVNRGRSTTYTVTISAGSGFSGPVNLTVAGLPSRTTATFNPASLAGSGTSSLTVNVSRRAQRGTRALTITGTGGGRTHSVNVTLVGPIAMAISRRTLLERLGVGALSAAATRQIAFAESSAPGPLSSKDFIRLHRNESAHGPSPHARAAMRDAASQSARYPDAAAASLRRKLAVVHGVPVDRVILGCGSTEVLQLALDAFASRGRTILTARPTFETVAQLVRRAGSEIVDVPLAKDHSHDLQTMRDRVDARTGLVYICNPHNPTGSLTKRQDIDALLHSLPAGVQVVVDEAYHDFVGHSADYRSLIDRTDDPRVIVTRTFSKIHGLAGLRIGYGIAAAPTATIMRAHASSNDINIIAARAAEAALGDPEDVRTRVNTIADERQEFLNQANARMLQSIDSLTNFVMLNTDRPSMQVVDHFAQHRILVAGPVSGFDKYIRVSLGTPAEMREFWRVWDLMPGGHMHM